MTSQAPTTPPDAGLVAAAADEDHEASLARRTVSGLAWTISMGWGARIVQLFGTLLLTYFVDPEAMGEVTNAAVLVMTADRLSGLGVSNYLLTIRNPSREVAWHVSVALAVSGIVAMTALMLFAAPMSGLLRSPDLLSYLPGLILSSLLTRVGVVPERLLQGRLRFRDVSVSRAWSEMSYTLAATAMGVAGAGGMAVVGGNVCRSAVYLLLMARRVPPEHWLKPSRFSRPLARSIVAFGAPLTGANVFSIVARYWDNLVVSWMFGAAATGTYNLAYNLADIPASQIGEHITDVLTPSLVQLDGQARKRSLVRWLAILSLVVFPAAVGLGVVAPTLVRTALPPKWAAVAPMLVILSGIGILRPAGWAIGSYFVASGRARQVLAVMAVHVVALIGAMVALGSVFGPLGACVGVGLGFCVYAGGYMLALVRTEHVPWGDLLDAMSRPLYACVAMVLAVLGARAVLEASGFWIRGVNLAVEVAVGAAVYAAVSLVVARPVVRDAVFLLRDTWAARRASVEAVASGA